jgi:hypothetical protein
VIPQQVVATIDEHVRNIEYKSPEDIREELIRQGIPEESMPHLIPSPQDMLQPEDELEGET